LIVTIRTLIEGFKKRATLVKGDKVLFALLMKGLLCKKTAFFSETTLKGCKKVGWELRHALFPDKVFDLLNDLATTRVLYFPFSHRY